MPAKTQIVEFLGDKALVLPALLEAAIIGNEQAKYVLSLLQMAVSYAECPREAAPPSLRSDREACRIPDWRSIAAWRKAVVTDMVTFISLALSGSWRFSTMR